MVTQFENLFFDDFCDAMLSALDRIGYNGDVGFTNEVLAIVDDCIVKKAEKKREVGIYVCLSADERRRGKEGSLCIKVFEYDFHRPMEERYEIGSVQILYAHLKISKYGIIDMNLYEGIEIWS